MEEKIKVLDYKTGYNNLRKDLEVELSTSLVTLLFETEKEADIFINKCKEKTISALKRETDINLFVVWLYYPNTMEVLPDKLKLYWKRDEELHIFDISTYMMGEPQQKATERCTDDKLFITEILNDLNRHGFVPMGKADTMLRDWAKELRDKMNIPRSGLRKEFNKSVGSQNW